MTNDFRDKKRPDLIGSEKKMETTETNIKIKDENMTSKVRE
jgi:hypothetical protein